MNESKQLELFDWRPPRRRTRKPRAASEWKIVSVRETAGEQQSACENPIQAADYWRQHVATGGLYNPEVECFAVLLLNIRKRIRGHHLVSVGLLNQTLIHAREVFRAAIIGSAHSVVLMHNHPGGDCTPSQADLDATKKLIHAGRILDIRVLDHVIVGGKNHCSLLEANHLSFV